MKHLLLVATFALLAALLPSAPLHATGRNMEREADPMGSADPWGRADPWGQAAYC